jgi:hypothetical protein
MSSRSNISEGSTEIVGKSPVPYLLGGVGAMLTLIAFALIILAWSYIKDCGTGFSEDAIDNRSLGRHHIVEHGYVGKSETKKDMAELSDANDERVIVIMAGDDKPTFIAKATSVAVEV